MAISGRLFGDRLGTVKQLIGEEFPSLCPQRRQTYSKSSFELLCLCQLLPIETFENGAFEGAPFLFFPHIQKREAPPVRSSDDASLKNEGHPHKGDEPPPPFGRLALISILPLVFWWTIAGHQVGQRHGNSSGVDKSAMIRDSSATEGASPWQNWICRRGMKTQLLQK